MSEPDMHLATGWAGVASTLRQGSAKALFSGAIITLAPVAALVGIASSAFIVVGLGSITVALAEGLLGVAPAKGWRDRIGNILFLGVLGPIVAWLSGLASTVLMWETGLVDNDFAIWMLVPGNIATWLGVFAFAYFRGASVPAGIKSAHGHASVESVA